MAAEEPVGHSEYAWCLPGEPVLSPAQVERAVELAMAHGGRHRVGLSVVFVDDPTLAQMHAEHLGDPSETDVMSFDLGEEEGLVGELYVSVDRARKLAARRPVSLERELTLYVVHGSLHLCGFDDLEESERRRMRVAEARVMEQLGFEEDSLDHHAGTD